MWGIHQSRSGVYVYRMVSPHDGSVAATRPFVGAHGKSVLTRRTSIHEMAGLRAGDGGALRTPAESVRSGKFTGPVRSVLTAVLWVVMITVLVFGVSPAAADDRNIGHFGKNRLKFASVEPFLYPDATGTGIIEFKGGKEPSSQWRASFRFTGLEPGAKYAVVVKGRLGAPGSPEAAAYTPLCSFAADEQGQGACFWYFRGLARLTVVQLRDDDERGTQVLEARRSRGPGSIKTESNRFSPGGEISSHK